MSLHAQTSEEAQATLDAQKRNSTISSLIIAVLSMFLIGLIMFIISISIEKKTEYVTIPFGTQSVDSNEPETPKTTTEVQRKPSSPSATMAKVIASSIPSPTAIAVPDIQVTEAALDFGNGDDFGDGWGDGDGDGDGAGGAAGGFGAKSKIKGTLAGTFYDFKQDKDGKARASYTVGNDADFVRYAKRYQTARFSARGLKDNFSAKNQLFVRYIAIPFSSANSAPRFFGVENEVKPSGWLVHYTGKLKSPKKGRFRFVGQGDDYLSVAVNSSAKLIAPWPNLMSALKRSGANTRSQPSHKGPFGPNLVYGDWFDLKEGQEFTIDIGIGENPGGKVGFVLMIEEKDETYRKGSDGRNVLPPFVFGPLTAEDKQTLKAFSGWDFELDKVPPFTAIE